MARFALGALVPFIPALAEAQDRRRSWTSAPRRATCSSSSGASPFRADAVAWAPRVYPRRRGASRATSASSFAAHRAQGGAAPERVFLCGGGAFVSGAEGFLSGALEIPVQLLPEPLARRNSACCPARRSDLPRYAKAVSLALSLAGRGAGMNLRRGPLAFERGFAWVRERIPVLAGLAAVILVSFVFSAWARISRGARERDALQAALGTVTKEVLGTEATTPTTRRTSSPRKRP